MEHANYAKERGSGIEDILCTLEKKEWDHTIEHIYTIDFNQFNPQERAILIYQLQEWYTLYGNTIPSDKKPLIELKTTILQTGFDVEHSATTLRARAQGQINTSSRYGIKYDILTDYNTGNRETDGQARLRFPFHTIDGLEFLQDIKVDEKGNIEGISGINTVMKKGDNTYQFGVGVSTDHKTLLTARIRTIHGVFGTRNIISFTINDHSLSMRNDITYKLFEGCSALLSIKSKINPQNIEINPVIGIEYNF